MLTLPTTSRLPENLQTPSAPISGDFKLPPLPFMQGYGPLRMPGGELVQNPLVRFKDSDDDAVQLDLNLDNQPRVTDDQAVGEITAVRDSDGTLCYIDEEYNIVIPSGN